MPSTMHAVCVTKYQKKSLWSAGDSLWVKATHIANILRCRILDVWPSKATKFWRGFLQQNPNVYLISMQVPVTAFCAGWKRKMPAGAKPPNHTCSDSDIHRESVTSGNIQK
eukprot:scaffold46648_cov42-Prasinocladus_malaysianus.AAC.2